MYSIDENKVLWKEVEGEIVVFDIDTSYYYTFDNLSTIVWKMILHHDDTGKIIEKIINEYDVDRATAKKDITDLLSGLEKYKLIRLE